MRACSDSRPLGARPQLSCQNRGTPALKPCRPCQKPGSSLVTTLVPGSLQLQLAHIGHERHLALLGDCGRRAEPRAVNAHRHESVNARLGPRPRQVGTKLVVRLSVHAHVD
eukprot:scaffold14602_cov118-Isochrysis_galbana.AAC.11